MGQEQPAREHAQRHPPLDISHVGAPEVLDAIADGAYITDCDRKIVFWSRAAEAITGWSAGDVVGHCCSDNILVHIDKDGHQLCGKDSCPLHRSIVTGGQSRTPLLVFAQHKQGHRVPVEVSVSPLKSPGGQIIGGIEVFRGLADVMSDLQRAKTIQDEALQNRLPEDSRITFQVVYQPEELIGGDFYQLEALTADCYAVMVADVMGHGIASALYTMQLRSIWEECRTTLAHPACFLQELNGRLHKLVSNQGYFATAAQMHLNARTGQLVYALAGHPPPVLLHGDGQIERLGSPSLAMGFSESATYRENAVQLRPGDQVLIYTDGAVEIPDAQGRELGPDGFLHLLRNASPRQRLDLEQIRQALLAYSNSIRLPDDLTLVNIEYCG